MYYYKIALAVLAWTLATGPASAAQYVVVQKNNTFSETELTVKPNEEVVFRNEDSVVHNVFSATEGLKFNLKSQPPGDESGVVLSHEGTTDVRCVFHPAMKLKLTVKK